MNPLISIVIPIYNVEQYLRQCITCVMNQSYQNLEIILVDDGSPDLCGDICDEYAKIDSRIRVIHKPNGGLSDARNVGIEKASGEFISFIDSDDYVSEDYIEYLFELLSKAKADISVCQRQEVDEEGNAIGKQIFVEDKIINGNDACMHCYLSEKSIDTVAWGKLYKKEMFTQVRYPVGKYHEDVFTTYRLIALCEKIAIGSEKKYAYRFRDDSITKCSFSKKHLDAVEGTIMRGVFVKENYPQFAKIANSQIVYAANNCVIKMLRAKVYDTEILHDLQGVYRRYEKDFLLGPSRKAAKIFSIAAFIHLRFFVWGLLRIRRR